MWSIDSDAWEWDGMLPLAQESVIPLKTWFGAAGSSCTDLCQSWASPSRAKPIPPPRWAAPLPIRTLKFWLALLMRHATSAVIIHSPAGKLRSPFSLHADLSLWKPLMYRSGFLKSLGKTLCQGIPSYSRIPRLPSPWEAPPPFWRLIVTPFWVMPLTVWR